MGNLSCICGNILSDICGCDVEAFTQDQIRSVDFNENDYFLVGEGKSILECKECGALAIEDPIDSCYVKFYLPENGKFNRLFKGE